MGRVNQTIKNVIYSYVSVIPSTLLNIITRYIFIRYISVEYLGASGLFTSIFSILSFVDLGLGEAITYKLYKPLANEKWDEVHALMRFYKLFYRILMLVVFILGICCVPFLPQLTNNSKLDNLVVIYLMYLLSTILGYFNADKKSFLIANQQSWINNIIENALYCTQYIVQIIVIITTRNFILYLTIQLLAQFMIGIFANFYVRKNNAYLYKKDLKNELSKDEKFSLFKSSGALFFQKLGSLLFDNLTSIIISSNLGLMIMGYYSNYLTVINMVVILLSYLTIPTQASIGNLCASTKDPLYLETVLNRMEFLLFFIYSTVSVVMIVCFDLVIKIYTGTVYFDKFIVCLLLFNFMVTGTKIIIRQFKTVEGLFTKDVFRPLIESGIYFTVGTVTVKYIGLTGALLIYVLVRFFSNSLIDRYLVYKYTFNKSFIPSFILLFIRIVFTIVCGLALSLLINNIYVINDFVSMIVYAFISCVVYVVMFILIYHKNGSFIYWLNLMISKLKEITLKLRKKA